MNVIAFYSESFIDCLLWVYEYCRKPNPSRFYMQSRMRTEGRGTDGAIESRKVSIESQRTTITTTKATEQITFGKVSGLKTFTLDSIASQSA